MSNNNQEVIRHIDAARRDKKASAFFNIFAGIGLVGSVVASSLYAAQELTNYASGSDVPIEVEGTTETPIGSEPLETDLQGVGSLDIDVLDYGVTLPLVVSVVAATLLCFILGQVFSAMAKNHEGKAKKLEIEGKGKDLVVEKEKENVKQEGKGSEFADRYLRESNYSEESKGRF